MSSKFNIGSVIYDATTGTEQGKILHDGNYTETTTPTDDDTILIKQSGVTKQVTRGDFKGQVEDMIIGSINGSGTIDTLGRIGNASVFAVIGINSDNEPTTSIVQRYTAISLTVPLRLYEGDTLLAEVTRGIGELNVTVFETGARVQVRQLVVV